MDIDTLDFETFWDVDYSLSRMAPLAYVMDDRYETISLSAKMNDEKPVVVFGEDDIRALLRDRKLSNKMALGHNMSGFDALILAHRFGINPRMWGCTLSMARPIHSKDVGLSLAKLSAHYGLGVKDATVLHNTKGRRLKDFTRQEIREMTMYNGDDSNLCKGLFDKLKPHYTAKELWHIDATVRMRTEPAFKLDTGLLHTALSVERSNKHKSLLDLAKQLGITSETWEEESVAESVRSELASTPKFSALLERLGVEVPMKASPTNPEKMIPALSKTDDDFLALQEHDNPIVAAAAMARLSVKSTLVETRVQAFLDTSAMSGGRLPAPIKYAGADTTGRDSGEEYNLQNLPRIGPTAKTSDALRNSLCAPEGYSIIVADQSGIELRVNHFLWQVPSSMALYRASPDKADLYRAFAATMYTKAPEDVNKGERQLGKVAQLGLGFGSGGKTFQRVAKNMGGIVIELPTAENTVFTWRSAYPEIVDGWKLAAYGVKDVAAGTEAEIDPWGLVTTCEHGFVLPSGRLIRYPNLRIEEDGKWPDGRLKKSWFYGLGRHKARITGPKAVENIVQALARDSVFDCAIDFYKLTGLRPALKVHDELIYVVPTPKAEGLLAKLQGVMRTPPKWWPELVVWSEGDVGATYGAAK